MTEAILILCCLIFLVSIMILKQVFDVNISLRTENAEIRKENISLRERNSEALKEIKKIKVEYEILPGCKVLLKNYGLTYKDENHDFKVDYEADVIEVSTDQVKLTAYGFTSRDSKANELKNRSGIISFLKNTWIDKRSVELILDKTHLRDTKIDQILQ